MHIIQTLKNIFSKKTKPLKHVTGLTDSEPQERSAILDLSSKAMSRIASVTLFFFLSQTFGSILWANPGLPKHHHFHESGYVGLHIVPELDAHDKVTGLRLNVSVSDRLYGAPKQKNTDIGTARSQKSRTSAKQVCSTLLTPDIFGGNQSLLSKIPELSAEISGIVDNSLKDLFFITSDTGDISITSRGSAKTNRNLYISIMGGVTVQNLRAQGLCVQARSLDIKGKGNDITRLDYIKPEGAGDAFVTLQEDAVLNSEKMTLHKTTFQNYGTSVVKKMIGHQAFLHNHNALNADILGNFQEFKNLGMEAEYTGKVTADIVTTHNENAITLLTGSQLKGRHVHNDHKKAVWKALDGSNIEVKEIDNSGRLFMEGSGSSLFVKSLQNNIDADLKIDAFSMIGRFINSGNAQKRARAVFSGFCEFDSIDNAGRLETHNVTKIKRHKNENNTVSGFINRSGAKAKLTKLEVGYGDIHYMTNSGYLELIDADEEKGPKYLKNNNGATLLVRGGHFKTLENEGRVEVHTSSQFETIHNLAKKEGQKTPVMLFKARVQTDTLTNAGELYALSGLTYTKKITNKEGAKARIQGLAYAPASEGAAIKDGYDLENQGALDLTQVDQTQAPKRVKNTAEGSLALHDNQGEWNHAAFKDINSKESAFKRGLVVEHLMNEGLFQYWDGVYNIKDIKNIERATFLTGHKDINHKNGCLSYQTFSNKGVWESTRGLALRDVTKTGKLRVNGALTVYGSKGVNVSTVLKGDIQAQSITLNGHTFHNTKGTHLDVFWTKGEGADKQVVLMPLTLKVKDFTNAGRILAGALTLTSDTFLQTDMGLIETQDDINIDVKGDVNNKWGQIRSQAKTKVKSKEGSILVGARGAKAGYVSKRNGASIEGGTHLTLDAQKTIDAGFGELYLKGKRLNATTLNHVPYMHLKAGLQILLEAGFIYSSRSILFETPTFRSFLSPCATSNDYIAHIFKSNWYNGNHWATTDHITCEPTQIISGNSITFDVSSANLQASKISAAGNIKRSLDNQQHLCTHTNSQGLVLQSVTYVHRPWRGGKAGEPLGHEVRGVYPTILSSGADVQDMTEGTFTLSGLVGILATNITIIAGSASMHGAAGSLFGFSDAHVQTGSGIATDIFASARQFSASTFQRTENTLNLTGSTPQQHIAAGEQRPFSGSRSTTNMQSTFVKPLFTSAFFQAQSLSTQALTFLTQGEKPLELPGGCSFRDAYQHAGVSELSLHEARNLPTAFSLQDMEMLYDMSHGGLLHKTTVENTFLQTLANAFEFSRGTGYIDATELKNFNKPFTIFIIVKQNGNSTIRPYTITPKEYYEDRAKLAISTLLASNAFYLKTHEDIAINRLAMKAKTIDVTGRTIDFNRFATVSEGDTTFAAQSFLLDRAGDHTATTIRFFCGGPIVIGEDHDVYEHRIDTKDYKEHTVIRTSVPTKIEADLAHFESLGGEDITFVGTQIDVPHSTVKTPGGRVHFKLGTNTYYSYRFEDDSNAMMTDKTTTVQQDKTYVECKINGVMDIEGATKVIVEKVQKKRDIEGLNSAFLFGLLDEYEDAGSIPDPAFVKQLRGINPDMLEYILAKEVHEFTETNVSAPGMGLMAIVAVVTAVCTMGAGAAIAGGLMAAGGGALTGVAGAACSAAFSSLCVQTSMALMQNGGDPFKAAKSMCNSDTLKNIALAAVTAGACAYASDAMGLSDAAANVKDAGNIATDMPTATQGAATAGQGVQATKAGVDATAQAASLANSSLDVMQELATFANHAKEAAAHAVASATIQTAVGEKGAFKNFAQTALSSAVMRYTGGKIATAELTGLTEKLAHAASGAVFGVIAGGEKGAVSGATGALIASTVTATAHESGVKLENAKKLGAIASALPAFWHEYNVGIGSTAGMNAASATKDGIIYRLKEEAERQAIIARTQAEKAAKEKAAERIAAQKEAARQAAEKEHRRQGIEHAKAYNFTGAAPAAESSESLLGAIQTEEAFTHLESQVRAATAEHVIEGMKALSQATTTAKPGHKRSYSQEFLSLNAAVHMQANHAWEGLTAYEQEGIERASAFQAMANFGAESPMPFFGKGPAKYLSESDAGRAFSAGLHAGHNRMAEQGLDGMGEATHLGVDFCIPGGIDFGLAYAKGEITRSQFMAFQSAAIAAEAATGYLAAKAVKGVVKTGQRVARLTSEIRTAKGVRPKSAGVFGHVSREVTFGAARVNGGFVSQSGKFDNVPIAWKSPTGTEQTYRVFQRTDIDWSKVRTDGPLAYIGKTNTDAARAGFAPQLVDGHFATLHHINQNGLGNLVEASRRYHGVGKPGQDVLHSIYGRSKPHPTNPVDRPMFSQDTKAYWKNRINEVQ